jgi:hypothetical protein
MLIKFIFRLPSSEPKRSVSLTPLFQAWILKVAFTSRPPLSKTARSVLLVSSALALSLLSLMGLQTFSAAEVRLSFHPLSIWSLIYLFVCSGLTYTFDGTVMNNIQRAQGLVNNPMPCKPTVDYFAMVETDLRNRIVATVQRLDLELKIFEFLVGEHETALASLNDRKGPNPIVVD